MKLLEHCSDLKTGYGYSCSCSEIRRKQLRSVSFGTDALLQILLSPCLSTYFQRNFTEYTSYYTGVNLNKVKQNKKITLAALSSYYTSKTESLARFRSAIREAACDWLMHQMSAFLPNDYVDWPARP